VKHLRKYNEDVDQEFKFNEEYIKECFIEFFDDNEKYDVCEEADNTYDYIEHSLGINCPDLEIIEEYGIDNFIKTSEELADFYKEIEVCIEKVKIKYHDVDVILYQDNHTGGLNNPLHGTRFVWVKFRKNKKTTQ
jgi:hypothetical protein